ncbi:hypothetical protein M2139_001985 [Enterococcus sp. PF1-24]|uniref:hypothetical protein n=1 Tax=unclassified Enterococcus TaxID=2608891 RepID=UPI00247540DF|nr:MULTISPECIES: hypothetical protein [unclassified Enterococcus]MDH6364984.1 hypothetical protein [Enterococcus sp. PFB1-1]MDH6402085.1 hypothetical protein [Enterococcus sp. PF1-24]
MKKIFLTTLLAGSLLFTLVACGNDKQTTADTTAKSSDSTVVSDNNGNEVSPVTDETFEAVVVNVDDQNLTVAKNQNSNDLYRLTLEANKIVDAGGTTVPIEQLAEGQVLMITFNGIVAHSYPAFIGNYSKIEVTDRTDEATLTAAKDVLNSNGLNGETEESK